MQPEQHRRDYISRHIEAMRNRFSKGYMASLQGFPRWVAWSKETDETGTMHKVPRNPVYGYNASIKKPESWGTLEQALTAYASGRYEGIGVYLLAPYVLVDMDHSFNPATKQVTDERAATIIQLLNSSTEVSPRKKGTHVIVEAIPPGDNFRIPGLEVSTNWFSTVTTWHIPGTPIDIQQRQEAIETLYQEYALKPAPAPKMQNTGGGAERGSLFALPKEAANDEVLQQLFRGDTTGFPSPSNADFVLVLKLLHWTGDNIELTRKLFLASGLYREEKTERRTGSTTYLDLTIRNALTKRRNPPMKR